MLQHVIRVPKNRVKWREKLPFSLHELKVHLVLTLIIEITEIALWILIF